MTRLPLNTLPTFRVIAQTQNLRAAAETLHLTHSALSHQLRALETQLGHPLFERRGRRLLLNSAGEALLASVNKALAELDRGVSAAAAAAGLQAQSLRLSVVPSFAQRWLLPRMQGWRHRHPGLTLEISASPQLIDLAREGIHAGIRHGRGPWPGLASEELIGTQVPLILVGSPAAAKRLGLSRRSATLTAEGLGEEALLGHAEAWESWFAAAGVQRRVTPVAVFNDVGLLLQAAEQDLGLALARELLAADALREGRLRQLSPLSIVHAQALPYHLVYPPALKTWPPLLALRDWLQEELHRGSTAGS
ncbi:LysR substrate-binding domain-containing protein [Paucibacter sp. PLA-PC-4]|uniref:LysR substrate-binding domain-containing protein n=1 Tax=Paucibacter sp. PLA-PC-4 TaxID=2993655 RepID=UPI00224B6E2B|nr:LysR substrate-binding domain-containing protein [Paucibacter sp. PLA-PC-4]MCX2864445.1 LysR substrate-binding domain-containing protein [Paucibacter sp. PLA-PC-4]